MYAEHCMFLFYRDLFQTSSMSIMISSDTKMKYLGIQRENLMKVRRTACLGFVSSLFLSPVCRAARNVSWRCWGAKCVAFSWGTELLLLKLCWFKRSCSSGTVFPEGLNQLTAGEA